MPPPVCNKFYIQPPSSSCDFPLCPPWFPNPPPGNYCTVPNMRQKLRVTPLPSFGAKTDRSKESSRPYVQAGKLASLT